jgi:hypothetical protein
VIAPHRVQRYANVACHSLSDRPSAVPGGAARRDNSGSAAQGNARNYLLVAAKIDLAEQDARAIGRTFATSATFDRGGFDATAVAAKIYAKSMIARRLKKAAARSPSEASLS